MAYVIDEYNRGSTVKPLNLASINVGELVPEIHWHPFNVANCSEKGFPVYINLYEHICLKYVGIHLIWQMHKNFEIS